MGVRLVIYIDCFYQYVSVFEALCYLECGCMKRNSVLKITPNKSEHINSKYFKNMDFRQAYFDVLI